MVVRMRRNTGFVHQHVWLTVRVPLFLLFFNFWPAIVWLLLHPETPYTWDIREDDHFNLEYEI